MQFKAFTETIKLSHLLIYRFILRVVPLSLSPSSETRMKPAREIKAARDPRGKKHVLLAPRISRGHFFLAGLFCVSLEGLNERGTTRSLISFLLTTTMASQVAPSECLNRFADPA